MQEWLAALEKITNEEALPRFRPRFLSLLLALPLVGLGACSTSDVLNGLTQSKAYALSASVPYGDGARARLDIYAPRQPACPGKAPVVVFFYGGTWNSGEKADYAFVAAALAARGILTVIPDYRLYPEVSYPDFLVDNARAVAWTRREIASYGGDPQRLFLMGHSAGGYNAAMLALDARWLGRFDMSPTLLRGWIGLAGVYDFLPIENRQAQPVFHHPDYPPGSQPIDYADARSPAAFIGVDDGDRLVNPQRNSAQMARRLEQGGVPVQYRSYARLSHTLLIGVFADPLHWLAPVRDDVADFILRRADCGSAA
ncbi:alpha/beta hydrolase [Cupriavidus sp. 8B]